MSPREFVAKVKAYYGDLEYPAGQREELAEWLKANESELDVLFKAVTRVHSSKWKTLPDIAVFESREVQERMSEIAEASALALADQRRRHERETMIEERYASPEEVEVFLRGLVDRMREKVG